MAEPKPFSEKVILITGAGSGIGAGTAKYLAARGASLSLCDISADGLGKVSKDLQESFPEAQILTKTVDVSDAKQVEEWVLASKEKFGRVDGCVNSAGIIPKVGSIAEVDLDEWNKVLSVNLTGVLLCLKYQLPAIADGGSIVNLASIFGLYGSRAVPSYAASKHGVVGLTKAAAMESSDRNIRVNAVCPSYVDTPMVESSTANLKEIGIEWSVARAPQLFHRLVKPEEIAGLIGYLLSDESRFITKATYEISGGYAA